MRDLGEETLGRGLREWEEAFHYSGGFAWAAEVEGETVGFGVAETHGATESLLLVSDLVDRKFQGRGIGTALVLVRLATQSAAQFNQVGLLATEHSRGFYERLGFRVRDAGAESVELDPFIGLKIYPMVLAFSRDLSDRAWDWLEFHRVHVDLDSFS